MSQTVHIRWAPGFSAPVKAPVVHVALEQIRKQNDGVLKPVDVVDAARPVGHPLHPCFTWDNELAAEKHRQNEARAIIRSIRVIDHAKPDTEPAPVYLHVQADEPRAQRYLPTVQVMADEELRGRVLEEARVQLNALRKRFAHLQELAAVVKAVDDFLAGAA